MNSEIETLGSALTDAVDLLTDGGRFGVISYHSLEDRIAKRTFLDLARSCICPPEIPQCVCNHEAKVKIVTKKPVYPSAEEIHLNPRARSARLRFIERLPVSLPNINEQTSSQQLPELANAYSASLVLTSETSYLLPGMKYSLDRILAGSHSVYVKEVLDWPADITQAEFFQELEYSEICKINTLMLYTIIILDFLAHFVNNTVHLRPSGFVWKTNH